MESYLSVVCNFQPNVLLFKSFGLWLDLCLLLYGIAEVHYYPLFYFIKWSLMVLFLTKRKIYFTIFEYNF